MLDSLLAMYVQLMIMLIELQKVISQGLQCLCGKSTTVLSEWPVPKTVGVSPLNFYGIKNKYIV